MKDIYINKKVQVSFEQQLKKNFSSDINLSITEYTNAIIATNESYNGGVYYKDQFVYNTSLHRTWAKGNVACVKASEEVNEPVVYIGMFHNVWGHCITDDIKHLWFLLDSKYDSLKSLKFVYLTVYDDFKMPENFLKILHILGINDEQLVKITENTRFSSVYVPDECFFYDPEYDCYRYTLLYKDLVDFVVKDIVPDFTYEKVYFSRTALNSKKDIGEHHLDSFFAKQGYFIAHPEKMTFEQQVAILKGCKSFACTEGSVSHNSIFCSSDCKVLILRKDRYNINGYQLAINNMKKYPVNFIDVNHSVLLDKKTPWNGSFFLYVSKYLTKYFGCKRQIFPLLEFIFVYIPIQLKNRIKPLLHKIKLYIVRR